MLIRHAMRRGAVSVVAAVAVAGLPVVGGAAPAVAAPAPQNGLIGYTHTADLNAARGDALAVAPTGGEPLTIAAGSAGPPPVIAAFPIYTPDGGRVVFSRGAENASVPIFLAAADGTSRVQLTQTAGTPANRTQDAPAGFSPDGKVLAFSRTVMVGSETRQQVWVVDLATKVERRMGSSDNVVFGFNGLAAGGGQGVFSADGSRVVFGDSSFSSGGNVYRAQVSNGAVEQVTAFGSAGVAGYPVFSPDGSRIAFGAAIATSPDQTCGIATVASTATMIDGTVPDSVSPVIAGTCTGAAEVPAPLYAPDGRTIVFTRPGAIHTPVGASQLMAVPAAGGTAMALTALPTGGAVAPVFSPDGSRIAFSRLTPPAEPSDPPTLSVAVLTIADPARTVTPLSGGGGDVVTSWQKAPVGGDPCLAGTPAPAGYRLIEGTDGDNELSGTSAAEVIRGRGGADVLHGGGGNDILCGDNGRDRLIGGPGADLVRGGDDIDVLIGGPGDDVLRGGARGDEVRGGAGNDVVDGGRGNDTLSGGHGQDALIGGPGQDTGVGGPGTDTFTGVEDQTQ